MTMRQRSDCDRCCLKFPHFEINTLIIIYRAILHQINPRHLHFVIHFRYFRFFIQLKFSRFSTCGCSNLLEIQEEFQKYQLSGYIDRQILLFSLETPMKKQLLICRAQHNLPCMSTLSNLTGDKNRKTLLLFFLVQCPVDSVQVHSNHSIGNC